MTGNTVKRLAMALSLIVCSHTGSQAQSDLFILTSDFATGSTALLPAGAATAQVNLLGVHSDAVGVFQQGMIYVVNRLGADNILVLDPADPGIPVTQFSVGNGSNPQDIEVLSADKAYVTRYESTEMLIVDPRDGTEVGTIDLSAYADDDGLPEMTQIVRVGDLLYVSCQRLDRNAGFVPGEGVLVIIDSATDAIVGDIALSAANPNGMITAGDRIIVSGSAGFGDRLGGIDVVDTRSASSLGLAITEEQLGGDISALVLRTSNAGFAVVLDESYANSVVPVNLATGVVGAPLEGLSGGFIATIAIDGDRLLIGDQGSFTDPTSAGLKIYDAPTGAFRAGPVDTGLPPNSIVVLSEAVITAVRGELSTALPVAMDLGRGFPNPFNASIRIPFTIPADVNVEMHVYDLLGRRVQTLVSQRLVAGAYSATWNGADQSGHIAANGSYFVRLVAGTGHSATKVMLLK